MSKITHEELVQTAKLLYNSFDIIGDTIIYDEDGLIGLYDHSNDFTVEPKYKCVVPREKYVCCNFNNNDELIAFSDGGEIYFINGEKIKSIMVKGQTTCLECPSTDFNILVVINREFGSGSDTTRKITIYNVNNGEIIYNGEAKSIMNIGSKKYVPFSFKDGHNKIFAIDCDGYLGSVEDILKHRGFNSVEINKKGSSVKYTINTDKEEVILNSYGQEYYASSCSI